MTQDEKITIMWNEFANHDNFIGSLMFLGLKIADGEINRLDSSSTEEIKWFCKVVYELIESDYNANTLSSEEKIHFIAIHQSLMKLSN
jgi:hypothetical protein